MAADSLVNQIKSTFIEKFSSGNFLLINAPGRINLIGEHTDYNHGFVLPGAIDKSIVFGMGRNDSNLIQIHSIKKEEFTIDIENPQFSSGPGWSKYFVAMVDEIRERKLSLGGVNCCFGGDIPIGSGMSSSAALCCGFLFGLNHLFAWNLPLLELAKIGQAAEHRVGANVGLMDQFASLFGRKDNVICLDCLDYSYQYFSLDLKGHNLILINSNVKHEIADSKYNDRRESCEFILAKLQRSNSEIRTLRDISISDLKILSKDHPQDIRPVAFVLEENRRVHETTEALVGNDLKKIGELLYQSHQGLSKEYEVSCPELDLLVELASKEESVLGARMMGGGFGGCTINLIHNKEVDLVVTRIKQKYMEETGIIAETYPVSLEDGVKLLNHE